MRLAFHVALASLACAAAAISACSGTAAAPAYPAIPDAAGENPSTALADAAPLDDAASGDDGSGPAAMSFDFSECPPSPPTGDFPLDVGDVVHRKCQVCHGSPLRHGAPFPELSYEDVQRPLPNHTTPIWQRMSYVIQPGSTPHMPLTGPQLTAGELQTLDAWFVACAPPVPEGTGEDFESSDAAAGAGGDAASDAAPDIATDAPSE
jgi:hypothetical protein